MFCLNVESLTSMAASRSARSLLPAATRLSTGLDIDTAPHSAAASGAVLLPATRRQGTLQPTHRPPGPPRQPASACPVWLLKENDALAFFVL